MLCRKKKKKIGQQFMSELSQSETVFHPRKVAKLGSLLKYDNCETLVSIYCSCNLVYNERCRIYNQKDTPMLFLLFYDFGLVHVELEYYFGVPRQLHTTICLEHLSYIWMHL